MRVYIQIAHNLLARSTITLRSIVDIRHFGKYFSCGALSSLLLNALILFRKRMFLYWRCEAGPLSKLHVVNTIGTKLYFHSA